MLVASVPLVYAFVYQQQSQSIGQTIINVLTNLEDYVDNNTSNVDSSADKGTHSNFENQQSGPDSTYDTLTEDSSSVSNVTLIDSESFEGTWPPSGWTITGTGDWNKESMRVYDGSYSADYDGSLYYSSGDLDTPDLVCSDATAIYIDFWYNDIGCDADDLLLKYYNGSGWNTILDLGATTQEDQWHHYQEKITDSQYFVSNFKVRWSAVTVYSNEHFYFDLVTIKKEESPENIRVDVWDGATWQNMFTDLTNGWNNVTVSSYLIASTFTIRFKGTSETDDLTQDLWYIDATLLHVWES